MVNSGASSEAPSENRISRRAFNGLAAAAGVCWLVPRAESAAALASQSFIHPGILHAAADLDRMRKGVQRNRFPIAEGFDKLRDHPLSRSEYAPGPFSVEIGRNPSVNSFAFDRDSCAAYQCSLLAAITGDDLYAHTARTIVQGWSGSLQRVSGADAVLMAGLGPFKLINAAEILRATGALDAAGAQAFAAMLRRAILPTIIDFALFANGNWDTAAIKTMLAIAVFCDDRPLFERALQYYLHGDGDGCLTNYVYDNGQCQESGRDQQHTQLGLAHMGDACEIAWHQGLDLYGAINNRLLLGFEYTASYNLGDAVQFNPDVDRTGKYRHQVISPRGPLRPIYEQIFAHYHVRRGLPAPAVARAVEKVRPEGVAQGADHTGFGTLLYALEPADVEQQAIPVVPAALHAEVKDGAVELNWLAPRNFRDFFVERAEENSSYRRIKGATRGEIFRDSAVKHGRKYMYRLVVRGAAIPELSSAPAQTVFGLPPRWSSAALGSQAIPGSVQFDGEVLNLHAAGSGLMSPNDEGYFVATPPDCIAVTARFVPQIASQSAMFGLACRKSIAADAPCHALLVLPQSGNRERSGWLIRFVIRDLQGGVRTVFESPLEQPVVEYGRLMKPVWLRLQREDSVILAQSSTDGVVWKDAGRAPSSDGGLMGFMASSGLVEIDTAVRFDSISVSAE